MIELQIKNSDGIFNITQFAPQIEWSGDYKQCCRTLNFSIASSPTDRNIPSVKCDLGDYVTLLQDGQILFIGNIVSRQKSTLDNQIDLVCFDRGFYLKRNKTSYKFTSASPETIARRVCADFGIDVGQLAATGETISRNFLGCTLYDVIMTAYTLAAQKNKKQYIIRFRATALYVEEKGINDQTLIIEGGANLMDASITESIQNMINSVVIYDKNDKQINNVKDNTLIQKYGTLQEYIKQSDNDNALDKAKKLLLDNGVEQKITVNTVGNAACTTGNAVVVREPYTGIYGLFYIDSDTHTWKNGQYYNKLVLNFRNIMDEKEVGALPNQAGNSRTGTKSKKTVASTDSGEWTYTNKPG